MLDDVTRQLRSAITFFSLALLSAGLPASAGLGVASANLPVLSSFQQPVPLWEIPVSGNDEAGRIQRLDLDIVASRPGAWIRVLGWPGDLERIRAAGFRVRVIDSDHGRAIAIRNGVAGSGTRSTSGSRDGTPGSGTGSGSGNRDGTPGSGTGSGSALRPGGFALLSVPPPGSGSMGGFYTLAEANALLDSLSANDPAGIVSPVDSIGASVRGRAIRALRIGDESQPDHSRPRVLLTSLTHAREPGGMQALFYFMDRLISGYGTDPNITYLVDNREIWFVPVVNPDGYAYNESTWVASGSFGLWRKNLRDNNNSGTITSADGVDNNRNFGFQWGFDNNGSSGTPSSATYRGPAAFSEPETRTLRDFAIQHGFSTANNYHTHSELCLYSWSYDGTDTPDSEFFIRMVNAMMRDAKYAYGVVADILYPVNGDANDWMYGDQVAKPKAFSVTTEVGNANDNFWPPAARINPLSALQDYSNIVLAYSAGTFVHADSTWISGGDGFLHPGLSADVSVRARNAGRLDSDGPVSVTASTSTPGITVSDAACTYPAIAAGTTADPSGGDVFTLNASPLIASGTVVSVVLTITDSGQFLFVDTVQVTVGEPVVVFADDAGSGLGNWTTIGGWGIQVVGADSVFSDSPTGDYSANTDRTLTLTAPLDLSGGLAASLSFRTTFDMEIGYDGGFVQVSTNGGGSWTSVPGRMTKPGHGTTGAYSGGKQPLGEPVYDANRKIESAEVIDLTAWAGLTDVRLRFRLQSDSGLQRGGWLVDDIQVLAYPMDVSAVAFDDAGRGARPRVLLSPAWPNPSRSGAHVTATFPDPTPFTATVYSVDGRLVRRIAQGIADGARDFFWDGSAEDGRPAVAGRYFMRVQWKGGAETAALIRVR